ncbi:MAG TPA: L-threonylcarbamoyladenylate synthase [Candidatus Limnocylindrales bacterium]|nr:L-threonylcarbamoyladenylate synthase [Candidatus Limnocylindrales bacterium]
MTARVVSDDAAGRAEAIDVLKAGGIVALPTDTVYGIAVALSTPGGIERLFAAKRRPPDKGIMLLLDDAAQAGTAGAMTPAAAALARALWPGGLTVIVPQRPDVPWPPALTGGAQTIGLRVPDHPAPRALATGVGPLPTTSANVSGLPEASDAAAILEQLGDAVDLVLDGGPAHGGPASTVVDCSGPLPTILRAGAVPVREIAAVLDKADVAHGLREAGERDASG